jgi:hypothetical protein
VVLWRAGLRIQEALDLTELDLDARRGSVLVRRGNGGQRREVGLRDVTVPFREFVTIAGTAGALAGDVPSLARWAHRLFGGRILSAASLREMSRFHDGAFWQGYVLGLARDSVDGRADDRP